MDSGKINYKIHFFPIIQSTIAEKKRKYQALSVELKDMYKLQGVEIVPVVVSANGRITGDWKVAKSKSQLDEGHMRTCQKAALNY